MTLAKKNFALNSTSLTNIVFSFFPFSFILGNLIINLNFLLFCCLGIFHLRSKILTNKLNFPLKIISLFFLLVLFSTSLNFIESLYFGESDKFDLSRLIKSILFLRFFIILLLVFLLSKFEIINYKLFFTLVAILPVLISIDVIFQYIFGFNVIGIKSLLHHNSSFFGDELIAGGYIQNFSFFSILFLTHLIKKNENIFKIFLTTLTICTLAIGIMLSGNRMPFFLFLFGLFLLFLLHKDSRKTVLISYLIIFIIFELIKYTDRNILNAYNSFFSNMQTSVVSLSVKVKNDLLSNTQGKEKSEKEEKWKEDLNENPEANPYKKMALTAIEIWKPNKIFGNGIKSFRVKCQKVIIEQKRGLCSTHPHNYYLEILVDLGIAGILLVILLAVTFIVFLAKKYKNLSKNNLQNLFLLAAIISLFLEVFPIKSSGSIFTTNNATYLILMSSIVLSYQNLLKEKNFG
jgi:hypothetical protein